MDYNFLKIEKEGGITILKISAPKSLNALNSTILKELAHFVDNLDISTRVLIITGDGEKSFVAGADISEMANLNEQQGYEFGKLGAQVFRAIEVLPIPVIAAVNGFHNEDILIDLAFSSDQLSIRNSAKKRLKELGYE